MWSEQERQRCLLSSQFGHACLKAHVFIPLYVIIQSNMWKARLILIRVKFQGCINKSLPVWWLITKEIYFIRCLVARVQSEVGVSATVVLQVQARDPFPGALLASGDSWQCLMSFGLCPHHNRDLSLSLCHFLLWAFLMGHFSVLSRTTQRGQDDFILRCLASSEGTWTDSKNMMSTKLVGELPQVS